MSTRSNTEWVVSLSDRQLADLLRARLSVCRSDDELVAAMTEAAYRLVIDRMPPERVTVTPDPWHAVSGDWIDLINTLDGDTPSHRWFTQNVGEDEQQTLYGAIPMEVAYGLSQVQALTKYAHLLQNSREFV